MLLISSFNHISPISSNRLPILVRKKHSQRVASILHKHQLFHITEEYTCFVVLEPSKCKRIIKNTWALFSVFADINFKLKNVLQKEKYKHVL